MSYILAQILVCLLIAGLIGAVIGWFLRGNCTNAIKKCEEEWKQRVGALESNYNSKLNNYIESKESEQATLKKDNSNKNSLFDSTLPYGLDRERVDLYKKCDLNFDETKYIEDKYDIHTIDTIEPLEIKRLNDLGFNSTKDLSSLIGNEKTIEKVAEELGVGVNKVKSWASIANLAELPGVNTKSAKLLEKSGIRSIKDLAKTDIDDIYTKLERLNSEFNILDKLPSKNMLSIWSKISKHLS